MKNFYVFIISICISALAFGNSLKPVEVQAYIKNILEECVIAAAGNVACPYLEKYTYSANLSIPQVKKALEDELGFNLSEASDQEAIFTLLPRILEYQDQLENEDNVRAIAYNKATSKVLDILRNMSHCCLSATYVDQETYWGTSINASAAIIINQISKEVYIFIIGDMNG